MDKGDRRMERKMRELKEEVESWKIKMKLEKERREASEKLLHELKEDMEVMKNKMRKWQRDLEDRREAEEEKIKKTEVIKKRQEERRGRRIIERIDYRSRREGRGEKKVYKEGETKCLVWERGLIVHLYNWSEKDSIKEWLEDLMEGVNCEVENTRSEITKKLIFKKKEEMEQIWERRGDFRESGKMRLEQWLTQEERRAKALILRELKNREEEETESGEKCLQEDIIAEVEGERYAYDEEKEWIYKRSKRSGKPVEANGSKRWRYEEEIEEEEE